MKITSRASDYALLLMIYLAGCRPGETKSVRQVALDLGISLRFLGNIAGKLAIARLVVSHRGNGGGVRLARPGRDITTLQVIEAVDGPLQTMFCHSPVEACSHEWSCQMKPLWDDIQSSVVGKLSETTIAHLAQTRPAYLAQDRNLPTFCVDPQTRLPAFAKDPSALQPPTDTSTLT